MGLLDLDSLMAEYAKPLLMQQQQAQAQEQQKPQSLLSSPAFSQALLNLGAGIAQAQANRYSTGQALAFGAQQFGNTIQQGRQRVEEQRRKDTEQRLAMMKDLMGIKINQEQLGLQKGAYDLQRQNTQSQIADREAKRRAEEARKAAQKEFLIQQGLDPNLVDAFPEQAAGQVFNKSQATPYTDLAKITADYKNGLITEDQYKTQTDGLMTGDPDAFTNEDKLRDEYNKLSEDYFSVQGAYNKVKNAAKDPSAAGDISLLINFMKINDPGSVVREGEFATAQNAAGVPQRVRAAYNNALSGERLTPEQRADFVGQAKNLFSAAEETQKLVIDRYRGMAKRYKLNPDNIVTNIATQTEIPTLSSNAIAEEIKRRGL
jgi:hypothetical protein